MELFDKAKTVPELLFICRLAANNEELAAIIHKNVKMDPNTIRLKGQLLVSMAEGTLVGSPAYRYMCEHHKMELTYVPNRRSIIVAWLESMGLHILVSKIPYEFYKD